MGKQEPVHRAAACEPPLPPAAIHVPYSLKPPIPPSLASHRFLEHALTGHDIEALLQHTFTEVYLARVGGSDISELC
jgi:hypothetical protein